MSHHTAIPGLSAQHIVLPHEDAAEFERLLTDLTRSFRPQSEIERALIRHAAESQWRTQRAYRLEAALMTLIAAGEDAEPVTPDQRIAAYMLGKPGDALAKVLRYATAAERAFYRALKELKQIAAARADVHVFSGAYDQPQFVLQNAQPHPVVSREPASEVPHAPDLKAA